MTEHGLATHMSLPMFTYLIDTHNRTEDSPEYSARLSIVIGHLKPVRERKTSCGCPNR